MTATLTCENLRGGYGETTILRDVRLRIESGDIYALIGKNGAGKSTLLKTIVGLLGPRRGTIELFGLDVAGWPTYRIIAAGVTYAPQENAFFSELTVDENLRLGSLSLNDRRFRTGRDRVIAMFPFMGTRLRQRAGTLSGGEQAMLKVARALLPEPRLVLLDEVSEGLQPLAIDRVARALMTEHRDRQVTMLVIEQNVNFASRLATRYGLFERGQISAEGSFSEADAVARINRHLSI
jgi:branched-chain amino acid transport system ATP-binding protein